VPRLVQIVSRLTPFLTADVTPYDFDSGTPKGVLLYWESTLYAKAGEPTRSMLPPSYPPR
jgi:hypothetical protein